jgi:TubC N-terminal docking domain
MGGTVSAAQLLTELTQRGIRIEAHGDRLRYSPRSAVTPDLADKMKAHKGDLLTILRSKSTNLGACPACGERLWEIATFDGFLNLECPACDRCYGCRPSTDEVAARFAGRPVKAIQICDESLEAMGEVYPCNPCSGLELWQSVAGDWRCLRCDPPSAARRLAEAAERIRRRTNRRADTRHNVKYLR